ncbi:hypothetical protein WG909_06360 [Peptostreptococcaceae bacterium AGR-M142]
MVIIVTIGLLHPKKPSQFSGGACHERNKDNKNTIDYDEIHQSWKQISSIIHNMNHDSIDTNTKKVINSMDITFSNIAPSNKISKDNAYLYYQKINILRDKIKKSLKNISFKDISNKDCNEILNVLRELEKILYQHPLTKNQLN